MKKIFSVSLSGLLFVAFFIGTVNATTYTVNGNLNKIAILQQGYEGNTIKWCDKCEPVKIDASSTGCYNVSLGGVSYIECTKIFDDNGKLIVENSSGSEKSSNLSVFVTNKDPDIKEWIELKINIDNDYVGKIYFSKMQKYENSKWNDISLSSKDVLDYSDDLDIGFVKFSLSDKGKMNLSKFVKFAQTGNYRIYVEDKDGFTDYAQIYVGKVDGTGAVNVNDTKKEDKDTNEEVYTSRSCKKYTIKYYKDLDVFSSPDLKKQEYFVNKDYFKRYIDSKNKPVEGCQTNSGWISTMYKDGSDRTDRYVASNGKVYFLEGEEGNYYSKELDSDLNVSTKFKTIKELKYYIRDHNFLTSMAF